MISRFITILLSARKCIKCRNGASNEFEDFSRNLRKSFLPNFRSTFTPFILDSICLGSLSGGASGARRGIEAQINTGTPC